MNILKQFHKFFLFLLSRVHLGRRKVKRVTTDTLIESWFGSPNEQGAIGSSDIGSEESTSLTEDTHTKEESE